MVLLRLFTMTNSKYSDFNHSFTRSRGAIRRYLRTSGTTKHIKNPYRYQTLEYVNHQLEFGFNPKWFFTFHYFTTEELFRLLRESKELYGFKERYGLGKEWKRDIFKVVDRLKWIDRRRIDYDFLTQDFRKLRNIELQTFYGVGKPSVGRFKNERKWKTLEKVKPSLTFHEIGIDKRLHSHQLVGELPPEYSHTDILEHVMNTFIKGKTKCLSLWKKIHVEEVWDSRGINDYLVKQTNVNHLSIDFENSLVIHPETKLLT